MTNRDGGIIINPAVNMNVEKMSDEQVDIFQRGVKDIIGVEFTPLLYVGSQVVAGMLYTYIASKRPIHPQPETTLGKVVILKDLNNKVSLQSVEDI
ncbi:hypothetical protein [Enterobacter sp. 186315]